MVTFSIIKKNDHVKKLQCVCLPCYPHTISLAKGLCTTRASMNYGLRCYLHVFRQGKTSLIPYLQSLQETFWPAGFDRYGINEWQEMHREKNRTCAFRMQAAFHQDAIRLLAYTDKIIPTTQTKMCISNSFPALTILSRKILHKAVKESRIIRVHKKRKARKIRAKQNVRH